MIVNINILSLIDTSVFVIVNNTISSLIATSDIRDSE